MQRKIFIGMVIGILLFGVANITSANQIYSNADLGVYSTYDLTINLNSLASHSEISINFDLYIYDSWDGQSDSYAGPDYFGFSVDGMDMFWSFDNFNPSDETNSDTADAVGNFNNINTWGAIDRYFDNYGNGFTFSHNSNSLTLKFYGLNLQGISDESWRVTNLEVYSNGTAPVPEPATMLLLGSGLIGLAGFRRKFIKS